MSGRRRQGLTPSLFPFLAVLVCTLGTLILLLALVAQNATDSAEQRAQAEQQAALKPAEEADPMPRLERAAVASMIEEEEFRVEQLVAVRDKQTGDVEERRDQLTHLEDHLRRLHEKLQRLNTEVERATGVIPTNIVDVSAIETLSAEIAEQEAALAKLESEAQDKSPRVVIVPHKGPNGTARRPIYIECTKDGVTVWPEGSQISMLQLGDSYPTANPLDGALRAIRYHSLQAYGDTTPPYPLLVVRPDGIDSYAAARKAMKDWDDQFGYELVPANVKLAFPDADSALKKRIDLAIREAAAKQHARHAIAGRAARQYSGRLPTLSAASLDRAGRAGGFRSGRDVRLPNNPNRYSSGPSYASGSGSSPRGTATNDSRSETIRRLDDRLRSAADEMKAESNQRGGSGPTYGDLRTPLADLQTPPSLQQGVQNNPLANGTTGSNRPSGQTTDSTGQPTGLASGDQGSRDPSELRDRGAGDPSNREGQPRPRSFGPAGSQQNGQQNGQRGETTPNQFAQSAGDPSALGSNPSQTSDQSQTGQPEKGSELSYADLTHPNRDGQADGTRAQGRSERNAPGAVPPRANGNASQAAARNSMSQAPRMGQSQPQGGQAGGNPSAGQSDPVRRQGRDWALPRSLAGARGNKIVRTIRVQCYEDRLVLLPSGGSGATEMYGFSDGQINRATLELATAVRDRVERWGAAIPGGRWQPRLDVEVMPSGETRFHQLRTLMQGSGVEVQGRNSR